MKTKVPRYDLFRPSSKLASQIKKRVKSKNTKAETSLRHQLWRLGLRYRLHVNNLPGKPDIVFPFARIAVFCDGDFWHGRNWKNLKKQLKSRENAEYWIPKIQSNIERDHTNTEALKCVGWRVIRVWETNVLQNPESCALKIFNVVRKKQVKNFSISRGGKGDGSIY